MHGMRIVIADADPAFRRNLKEKLIKAGYLVVGEVAEGRRVLQLSFNIEPDFVILDAKLPGMDGLEVAKIIEERRLAPVLLLTDIRKWDFLEKVKDSGVSAFLAKPVDETNLIPTIEIARLNFEKLVTLEEENKKLKESLETRKHIEKAKGLLMQKKGMTESEAYKYLQKLSMDKCLPMVKVAKTIISLLNDV